MLLAIVGYAASQLLDTFLDSLGFGDVFVGTDGSPVDDRGGGDPFERAVDHPFIALAGLVLPGHRRRGQLGCVALLALPGRRRPSSCAPGVLFRQHRQVRLDRIQAVELSRPLLARALGLAPGRGAVRRRDRLHAHPVVPRPRSGGGGPRAPDRARQPHRRGRPCSDRCRRLRGGGHRLVIGRRMSGPARTSSARRCRGPRPTPCSRCPTAGCRGDRPARVDLLSSGRWSCSG